LRIGERIQPGQDFVVGVGSMLPRAASDDGAFEESLDSEWSQVRRALLARWGAEIGSDAWSDVVVWAWEHRERLADMTNPAGYLYRVGQSAAKRQLRWYQSPPLLTEPSSVDGYDGDVFAALERLKPRQRVAVLLVHGHGASYAEAADVLGVSVAAVTNYVHRGMRQLRRALGDSE
jgi:RNA polymerase sigma factor (sigma-70 family)